jgi:CTP:molybdopterin cytidylyltransferase MocA
MKELSARGQKAAYRRNVEIAETAQPIAFQLCPKDSGDLASTIRVAKNPQALTASLAAGGPAQSGEDVDYAKYVEADQPFIKPAIVVALGRGRNRTVSLYRG